MLYKLFFFLLLYLLSSSVLGQDPYYINYDTKDGLPSSEVYAVEVDSNGIVWFATDRGVCSYNGYEFNTYTTDDGLASNTTLAIWKDRKGNFWFPGLDGSLTIYDHNKFYPYKWNDSIIAAISRPQDIAWNSDDKLYFWRAAQIQKIYSVDHQTGIVTHDTFSVLKEKYKSIKTENTEFIQIGRYYLPDSLSYSAPKVIKTDTSLYYAQQIDVLDTIDHFIFKHSNKTKKLSSYHFGSAVLSIYMGKNSDLWVCTKNGLYKFQNADLDRTPSHYFKDLIITDIMMDLEDNY